MTVVLIALPEPRASSLAAELAVEGVEVHALVPPSALLPLPPGIDAVLTTGTRAVLTPAVIAACDRARVRVMALGAADARLLARYGFGDALPADANGWEVAAALTADVPIITDRSAVAAPHRVTAVWGPSGSPGRSVLAIELAVELTRRGRRTVLVDADTVAPSVALLLGLSDDGPGIAAACRRAGMDALDEAELHRLTVSVDTSAGSVGVLAGINRPRRWPELSASRLSAALRVCRQVDEETIVDVASAFEGDDELTRDLPGPSRHAATAAVLQEADEVIAVASADPLGISRFLREHAELRSLIGPTPVRVVVNRVRPGPLGIDARGQVRRTLERFAGITDVHFFPFDQRAADAAHLHARPMADVTPRSSFVAGVRRLAASHTPLSDATTGGSSRGSSRGVRRLRRAPAARGG